MPNLRASSLGILQFFNDLMQCLTSLQVERDHRALDVDTKEKLPALIHNPP